MNPIPAFVTACLLAIPASPASAAPANDRNWPQFRGPDAAGLSSNPSQPESWSATENVAWKTDLPGKSWSSPIVWGDRIFLTTVINSGPSEPPKKGLYFGGDRPEPPASEHEWKVLALDLATGRIQWERTVHRGKPPIPTHLKGSYGAETPVVNGRHVHALFGGIGLFTFDLNGKPVWSHPMAPHRMRNGWGTAASPALLGDQLILVDDNEEASEVLALDSRTGRTRWQQARQEKSNWATPFVWTVGRHSELITCGTQGVRSYDPDGRPLWSLSGMSSIAIPTPVAGSGLLFVTSGYVGDKFRPLYAIRPGARGDISLAPGQTQNPAIAWSDPVGGPYNPSPIHHDGRLYVLYDRGLLTCRDAATGTIHYDRERLPDGFAFTASPWAARGSIFCLNEDGICYVVRAGDRFELIRTNRLAADDLCMATPALAGDRLLIRTAARLYCIQSNPTRGSKPSGTQSLSKP